MDETVSDVLVGTQWLSEHLNSLEIATIEVDIDTKAYDKGHIQGAHAWSWKRDLAHPVRRDIAEREALEGLLGRAGVGPDTTVVLYGDNNNWFAAWAFWQLSMHGMRKLRILDGGRRKWIEEGRPLVLEKPAPRAGRVPLGEADPSVRTRLAEVDAIVREPDGAVLVDVRSPAEYSGAVLAPPGMSETCQRGGHIPGARSIPWVKNCREDGTFRSPEELRRIYAAEGVTEDRRIITYCRIGERSSHTWFALKHILRFARVSNYDGSWTEWGNLVGVPIATGMTP